VARPCTGSAAAGAAKDEAEGTDFHATEQGHVVMTPLKVDLTDHDNLGYWAQTASRLGALVQWPAADDAARPGFPRGSALGQPPRLASLPPAVAPHSAPQCAAVAPHGPGLDSGGARRMVQKLRQGGISDPAVLQAMNAVERHRFVDSAW
jgi:hypothetical protein